MINKELSAKLSPWAYRDLWEIMDEHDNHALSIQDIADQLYQSGSAGEWAEDALWGYDHIDNAVSRAKNYLFQAPDELIPNSDVESMTYKAIAENDGIAKNVLINTAVDVLREEIERGLNALAEGGRVTKTHH